MMEILDGSNGSRRVQIEFLRNGETERPFVKLRAVRIEPGAISPWETHETEAKPSSTPRFADLANVAISGQLKVASVGGHRPAVKHVIRADDESCPI